jgi:hypothetical protein
MAALVFAGAAVHHAAAPKTAPLSLSSPGSSDYESSMRPVCGALLSISRTPADWHPEAWIAVQKGSALYSEIRSAKNLYFETDPGSGPSSVCVAEEFSYQTRPDLVNAVVAKCKPSVSLRTSQVGPEDQIVVHLANLVGTCEKPAGTPTLVTPTELRPVGR